MGYIPKLLMQALLWACPQVDDFLGPDRRNPFVYVPWERKLDAFARLAEHGDDRPYKRLLGEIREKRDYALDRSRSAANAIPGLERALRVETSRPFPRPDILASRTRSILGKRKVSSQWAAIHAGKVKEEAAMEALRRFIETGRAELQLRRLKDKASP